MTCLLAATTPGVGSARDNSVMASLESETEILTQQPRIDEQGMTELTAAMSEWGEHWTVARASAIERTA